MYSIKQNENKEDSLLTKRKNKSKSWDVISKFNEMQGKMI